MTVHPAHRFVDPPGPGNRAISRPPKWHTLTNPLDSLAAAIIVPRGEPARHRADYLASVEQQLGLYLVSYPFEGYTLSDNERRDLARRIVDEELRAGGGLNVYRGLVLHHLEAMLGKPDEARRAEVAEAAARVNGLPYEGGRALHAWTPGGRDERERIVGLVTADDGLQLVLSWDGDLHLAEGVGGVQLLDLVAALEAAAARVRPLAEVWAAEERLARARSVSSDPWTTEPSGLPPF